MKILFWNIRGMGNVSRVGILKDILAKENLDRMGIQETIKQSFTDWKLMALTPGHSYQWNWLPAKGHSGGILVGVKNDFTEVEGWNLGEHFLGVDIRQRNNNFRWRLLVVYGPANHELSRGFLTELDSTIKVFPLPFLVGGDFNLIRYLSDNSNNRGDRNLIGAFNDFINDNDL